jgi:hypothetical protein
MPGEMRPPPLPRDLPTEPGLGLLALKAENARLRLERDEARLERDEAQAALADAADSLPPPTSHQRRVRRAVSVGKYATLLAVLPVLGAAVAEWWPQYAGLVDTVLRAVGMRQ